MLFSWLHALLIFALISLLLSFPVFGLLSQPDIEAWVGFQCTLGIMAVGLILAVFSTYVAVPLTIGRLNPIHDPTFVSAMSAVCKRAGLADMPKLMCINTQEVNAMAYSSLLGPRVILTQGLVDTYRSSQFSLPELQAIMAHEMGHHIGLDTLKREVVFSGLVMARTAGWFLVIIGVALCAVAGENQPKKRQGRQRGRVSAGTFDATLLLVPIGIYLAAMGFLLQLLVKLISLVAFYHTRMTEYDADEIGARLTSPRLMANALLKMYGLSSNLPDAGRAFLPQAEKWQLQPLSVGWVERLFDTHPPLEKRVERLLALEQSNDQRPQQS